MKPLNPVWPRFWCWGMLQQLREKFFEVVKAIAPLIVVECVLQFTLVKAPHELFLQVLAGTLLAVGRRCSTASTPGTPDCDAGRQYR